MLNIKHYFIYMLVLFFSKYIVLEQKLLRLGCPHRETFRKKNNFCECLFFPEFLVQSRSCCYCFKKFVFLFYSTLFICKITQLFLFTPHPFIFCN